MTIKEVTENINRITDGENMKKYKEDHQKLKEMADVFNKEAIETNCNYRIYINVHDNGQAFALLNRIKKFKFLCFKWTEVEKINQIYMSDSYVFSFCGDGLKLREFADIEKVINKIPFEFVIEIKDGKVPVKYEIIKQLEQN